MNLKKIYSNKKHNFFSGLEGNVVEFDWKSYFIRFFLINISINIFLKNFSSGVMM